MGHYFDEDPDAPSSPRDVALWLPDMSLTLTTDRGVFGYDQIDAGTKLLLLKAPPPPATGDLLDLGCGVGAIALAMARRAPDATVWAVDVNARARDLCESNAAANGITNVRVVAPADVPPDIAFGCVWSNPPIRIGKPALHDLLLTWLGRLTVDGHAILVVQKHLGSDSLQRWLTEHDHPTERLASSSGYRILRARRAGEHDLPA
ncbi:MAG TPA: methyltransferase [Ilumatobacteraceae bacterium]|jgi:16S rRNA (guanine1207-N2)-methyltransferase